MSPNSRLVAVPFEERHLDLLPDAVQLRSRELLAEHLESPPHREHLLTKSRTVLYHGYPIAAWGVVPLWDGVASAWAWCTDPCRKVALPLVRLASKGVDEAIRELGLRRVQADVSVLLPVAVRFAICVGFEVEGMLRSYGTDGGDYYMMSKVVD